jgi:type IV secretory pathway VirB2 component (pilin)
VQREKFSHWKRFTCWFLQSLLALSVTLIFAGPVSAQTGTSPWENAVNVLQQSFTGTIAKGLSLVAIVIGGLTFAFGEGGSKRTFAGIVFGIGMAVLAVNFLSWLFGV